MSGEPHIILPGMLVVVAATISSGYLTKRESVFLSLLRARGFVYRTDPMAQSLRRIGVVNALDKRVVTLPREAQAEDIDQILADKPRWIRITDLEGPDILLKAVDLVHAREQAPDEAVYDLLEIPGDRKQTAVIDDHASLQEAHEQMEETGRQVLLVVNPTVPGIPRVVGVLTRQHIEDSYLNGSGL
jgi:CBS domain-containing protein